MSSKILKQISKTLTANDTGETGTHQAGVCIPKDTTLLDFFPALDARIKNPRSEIFFFEEDEVTKWEFAFIYYNNKLFGGTRNEYRLTCMTEYLRAKNAKPGDTLELSVDEDGRRRVGLRRLKGPATGDDGVIRLRGGWKIVNLKGDR